MPDPIANLVALATAAQAEVVAMQSQVASLQQQVQAMQQQLAASSQAVAAVVAKPKPGWLGMNSSANDEWAYCRWADGTRNAISWQDGSKGTLPFALNARLYPVGANINVTTTLWLLGCPAGDYQLTWSGNAAVTAGVYGGSYKATGPNSGVITLPAPEAWIHNQWGFNPSEPIAITVTASDPASPLDKLRLWLPGYGPGTAHGEPLYHDLDIEMCRKFACIRVMASQRTSDITLSPATTFASRATLDQWDWSSHNVAVPIEAEIERCQRAGVRCLWFSTPAGASDAWLTACAQFIHDRFHGTLIVEPPDELWNDTTFAGAKYIDAIANTTSPALYDGTIASGKWAPTAAGAPFVTDGYTRRARAAADYAARIAKIFQAAYADRPSDCQPTFGGCSADPRWITLGMQFLVARDGAHPFASFAIAPYAIDPWANNGQYYKQAGSAPTLTDFFDACAAYMADANQPGVLWQLAQHQALAQQYGAQLIGYEGGQVWYPQDHPYTGKDLSTQAQTDPRMGQMYDQFFALLHQYGFALYCDFLPVGTPWGQDGFWADMPDGYVDMTSAADVRWQAVMRESAKSN